MDQHGLLQGRQRYSFFSQKGEEEEAGGSKEKRDREDGEGSKENRDREDKGGSRENRDRQDGERSRGHSAQPLKIFYTNANGLFNKIDELKCIVSMYKSIEVICVTETHFSSDILDAEIYIEGFSMFRKDRDFRIDNSTANISGGGGSIIYVKNCCNASLVNSFLKAPDSLAVNINTSGGLISICCIYRSTSLNLEQNNALISCIKSICSERNDFETLLLGDFNLPNVLWETGSINSNFASKNQFLVTQQKYMDVFNDIC